MARPIKETPILRGKAAEEFTRAIEANENNKVSRHEYERAKAIYERVERSSRQK